MDKQAWLDLAEVIDAHRVVPKLILLLAFAGYGMFTYDVYFWIKEIYVQTKDIPVSAAAFAGGTLSSLGGVLTMLVNKYFDGGRQWGDVK